MQAKTLTPHASVLEAAYLKRLGEVRKRGEYTDVAKRLARQGNPIVPNAADILPWVLYDRLTVASATATATTIRLFTQPIGTASKTKQDTNLDQVQRLPDPQWFNATGLGFYFSSATVKADIDSFLDNYHIEFWIGQKVYAEGPLQVFPGGAGLAGETTQTAQSVFTIGQPYHSNTWDLRLPAGIDLGMDPQSGGLIVSDGIIGQTILQGQQFRVEILGTAFTTAAQTRLNVFLYGIISRGVQ